MIIFLYGEDNFRLKQKVKQLKEKFISASLGDTNLVVLDGQTATYPEISRQILAIPFLSRKRLVIIENLIRKGNKAVQEDVSQFLSQIPSSSVVAFVEEGLPDKRTGLFKKLAKAEQVAEYKPLIDEPLRRWIKKEVEVRGGNIDSQSINKLAQYVGGDLWRMTNEIAKLTAYNKQLTTESIELFVAPQVESNIFYLIEAVAAKNSHKAMKELYQLLADNQAEIYLLTMIVYQYRNLLMVKDLEEKNPRLNRFEAAKKTHLNPFVLGKLWPMLSQYTLAGLKSIYKKLLDYDFRLKTGKIEPRVALELLIFELTR